MRACSGSSVDCLSCPGLDKHIGHASRSTKGGWCGTMQATMQTEGSSPSQQHVGRMQNWQLSCIIYALWAPA